ncbi:molybdenum cofactor guanylyltransferase [Calothrix sp. 336/3]|uniref:molybdenum cofactor guanylyltransferase n=1 Tax=Calothrix sp. 336/3 TaxID=1337936 RepID=UPI0004E37DA6|nr:molybdenum cofactor guanylyltransferase [Calothrix sp. 336/3]AKG22764.1 molybdopterin-guanine dinucleotide biosynthesis protein A [Calothrix sp. 336/3]
MITITAIILAGGSSSRMGRDKALIPIHGVTLLERVCAVAASCTEKVYIITPWQERYQHLSLPKSEFIPELATQETKTPLTAFAQGLTLVTTEWVLLLACDLPKLQLDILQRWIVEIEQVEKTQMAALVPHEKGWEPLCGFYRGDCLPSLQKYIKQGGKSFQSWLKEQVIYPLPRIDAEMLFNCNTPQQIADISEMR